MKDAFYIVTIQWTSQEMILQVKPTGQGYKQAVSKGLFDREQRKFTE